MTIFTSEELHRHPDATPIKRTSILLYKRYLRTQISVNAKLLFLSQNSFIFLLLLIFSHHHRDREDDDQDQDEAYVANIFVFEDKTKRQKL